MIKVYLADDSSFFLDSLKYHFQQNNFNVIGCATNFEDLLSSFKIYSIDMLIVDVSMPKKLGAKDRGNLLEYMAIIKAFSADMQIFVMSGAVNFAMVSKLREYGISGYIVKHDELADPQTLPLTIQKAYLDKTPLFSKQVVELLITRSGQPQLTEQQIQVIQVFYSHQDKSLKQISQMLQLSEHTVSKHMSNARNSLGASTTLEAVKMLLNLGFLGNDL